MHFQSQKRLYRIANVCITVWCNQNPSAYQNHLSLSLFAVMAISHNNHDPRPLRKHANKPSHLSDNMPISHHAPPPLMPSSHHSFLQLCLSSIRNVRFLNCFISFLDAVGHDCKSSKVKSKRVMRALRVMRVMRIMRVMKVKPWLHILKYGYLNKYLYI